MAKGKKATRREGGSDDVAAEPSAEPVLALKLDSRSSEPVELAGDGGFQPPCTFTGLGAGFSGGMLGWVFGFGGYWMRQRLKGQWKASLAEGWASAKTFAIMGGLYAAVSCLAKRIRQREDGWNGAAAGCATGLALGWAGGPGSAVQSCALFGIFSYFIDNMSAGTAHAAAAACGGALDAGPGRSGSSATSGHETTAEAAARQGAAGGAAPGPQQWLGAAWLHLAGAMGAQGAEAQRGAGARPRSSEQLRDLLSPALPLLGALAPCQFGGEAGGCRVARRRR